MKTRMLRDIAVSEVGMGCMAFSHGYGKIPPAAYSIEAIKNAYDHGCTFFDTAEVYSPNLAGIGHNELIVGKALKSVRGSAVIATLLGTMGAIGAFYSKRQVSGAISAVNQIPVVNADVVTGFSLCILLVVVLGINKDTYIPLVAGHVTLCAPFVFLSVMPRIKQMDPSIYEAALDLGATPFTALMKVVIPQIIPGILSGFALAVTLL